MKKRSESHAEYVERVLDKHINKHPMILSRIMRKLGLRVNCPMPERVK